MCHVGEIRDVETADIDSRRDDRSPWVFSTLHTNDAVGGITVARHDVEPFLHRLCGEAFIATPRAHGFAQIASK